MAPFEPQKQHTVFKTVQSCLHFYYPQEKEKKKTSIRLLHVTFLFFLNKIAYRGCTEKQQLGKKKKSIVVLIKSIKKEGVL